VPSSPLCRFLSFSTILKKIHRVTHRLIVTKNAVCIDFQTESCYNLIEERQEPFVFSKRLSNQRKEGVSALNQKKIAEIAHVSPSTVSKALHGSRDVSPALAEKIKQIAMEHGYIKEKSSRKLSNLREKCPIIAIFCPEIISTYYSRNVTMIQSKIEAMGGESYIYSYDFSEEKFQHMVNTIITRNTCDGIIVLGSDSYAESTNLPIVYFERLTESYTRNSVCCDMGRVMDTSICHLAKTGCRHIGFMGEALTTGKLISFCNAMKKNNLSIAEEFLFVSAKRFYDAGVDCAEQLLSLEKRPDAIITAYDEIAFGAMYHLMKNGIRIPEDISFIGINNTRFAEYSSPSLTSVEIISEEICTQAIQNLFDHILNNKDETETIVFAPRLIVRESTKA